MHEYNVPTMVEGGSFVTPTTLEVLYGPLVFFFGTVAFQHIEGIFNS